MDNIHRKYVKHVHVKILPLNHTWVSRSVHHTPGAETQQTQTQYIKQHAS